MSAASPDPGVSQDAPVVFWDGYGLDNPHSGVGYHGAQLYKNLQQVGIQPTVVGDYELAKYFDQTIGSVVLSNAQKAKLLWPSLVYRKIKAHSRRTKRPQIYHGLSNINLPVLGRGRAVDRFIITIHDLIPFYPDADVSKAYRRQFQFMLKRVIRKADRIVAVSQWTAAEIRRLFPWATDKVVVIPNGRPDLPSSDVAMLSAPPAAGQVQILTVSRCEGYKRLPLVAEILNRSRDIQAVVVTDKSGKKQLLNDYFHLIQLGKLQLRTGVHEDELQRLFYESDMYVHPSLYEGYCLPAAEALSLGKPVIYTSGSGIDEVCGTEVCTALTRDASPLEWRDAILAKREELTDRQCQAGILAHCRTLPDWKSTAIEVKKLYNGVIPQ